MNDFITAQRFTEFLRRNYTNITPEIIMNFYLQHRSIILGQEEAGQEEAGQEEAGQEEAGQEEAGQEEAGQEHREVVFYSREAELNENIRYNEHLRNTTPTINRIIFPRRNRGNINLTSVVDENFTNRVSFPSTSIIERLFRDYIENKDKISMDEFNDSIIKLYKIYECPICYNSSDKSIKIKKCKHIFCETCIKKWLLENKNTCPTCRRDVRQ